MRSLLLLLVLSLAPPAAAQHNPFLAIPITDDFLNDRAIRGYFADLLRLGGYGHWSTERAAFLVRTETGDVRCVLWPAGGELNREHFSGKVPDGAVAIVHTHPEQTPRGSTGDHHLSQTYGVPIFVLTPRNIYLVTPAQPNVPVVEGRMWAIEVLGERKCAY